MIKIKKNTEKEKILVEVKKDEKVIKNLDNRDIFKYIYIENRLINLIIK